MKPKNKEIEDYFKEKIKRIEKVEKQLAIDKSLFKKLLGYEKKRKEAIMNHMM